MNGSLNHIYRLVWSCVQQAWVVVSEIANTHGKKTSASTPSKISPNWIAALFKMKPLAMLAGLVLSQLAYALPSAIETSYGSATTTVDGSSMTITQHSQKFIGKATGFDIATNESVLLNQPTSGIALIRIVGSSRTEIDGHLTATGKLFLVNENGILFGASSQVSAGGIVASTLNISDSDFLDNKFSFYSGSTAGDVVNKGIIKAADEGYIVLLGKTVENSGTLVADKGSVALASATAAELDFFGNGLVKTKLTGQAVEAIVKNSGRIQANGGIVQMATNGRSAAINVSGIIEADNLINHNGTIRLEGGDNAKVEISGSLLANGIGREGGEILITGEQVALTKNALVDASGTTDGGTVLIGGDYQGKNSQIYNARTTYIGSHATIKANAGAQGNGGKVIVWANKSSRFFGSISAQGGSDAGNGGFVEVSGKGHLNFAGNVDLKATHGNSGTLLLDPENIILSTSPSNNISGFTDNLELYSEDAGLDSTFNVGAGGSFSGVSTGATIILQANNDITVDSEFDIATATGQQNVSLVMQAKNNINVNANVTASDNGSITMWADSDTTGAGNLNINANITSQTGKITLLGFNISETSGAQVTTNAGDVNIVGFNNVNLGDLKVNTYDRGVGANLKTGGNVLIASTSNINMSGQINTVNPSASGINYTGGNGGTVKVLAIGDVNLNNTNINVSAETAVSTTNPSEYAVILGGNSVTMSNGLINTNGLANAGSGVTTNNTGSVRVAATGNVNLGTTSIDTSGATLVGANGVNAGDVEIIGQNVTVGSIVASGKEARSVSGNGGAGGVVKVTANAGTGSITMRSIDTTGGEGTGSGAKGNGGAITIDGIALLAADSTIDAKGANGGAVNFKNTVDSASTGTYALTVNSNGTTTFAGSVGATKSLASLTTDSGGTTEISGTTMQTTGAQTYNDDVNLNTSVSLITSGGDVTFNGVLNAAANSILIDTGLGSFTATSTSNQLSSISVASAEKVNVYDQDDLTIDSAVMTGDLLAQAVGTVTLAGNIVTTSTTNTAVQLVGARFNNTSDTNNIQTGPGGRWLIYSASQVGDTRGSNLNASYNFKQYNSNLSSAIEGSGNGFIYTEAPSITIGVSGSVNKVYDGTTSATGYTLSSSGAINSDTVTLSSTDAVFDNKNAGANKTVTVNGLTVNITDSNNKAVFGYQVNSSTSILGTITPQTLTNVSGITANNKLFDGTTAATLNTASAIYNGIIAGDNLTVSSATGAFSSATVGLGKTVNISNIALGGTDAANYTLADETATTTADILPEVDARNSSGFTAVPAVNPVFNSMTIVSLNPAATVDDPDYAPCPTASNLLGATPILNSGIKLPDGIQPNCI